MHFVNDTYQKTALPLLASTVQQSYRSAIAKHLKPAFGDRSLRDLTPATVQGYFSALPSQGVAHPMIVKLRDTLSSILRCAVEYEFLPKNPMDHLRLPPDKRGEIAKPWITPAEFTALLELIPEPYATMVYVAVFTGLRVSELAGLKWR